MKEVDSSNRLSGPLLSTYGRHDPLTDFGACIPGRPGSQFVRDESTRREAEASPQLRDESKFRDETRVDRGAREDPTMQTEGDARERRSCLEGVWRAEGNVSLPTYPKFQPVPSRVAPLRLPVSFPLSLPVPLTWRPCVSCGRPASPSAARELVYSTEHALCTGPCLLSCSSCSFVREIDVLLSLPVLLLTPFLCLFLSSSFLR